MREHLQLHALASQARHLFYRQLAGKGDARKAHFARDLQATRAAYVHLRRGVQGQLGQLAPEQRRQPHVLNDGCVDARLGGICHKGKRLVHLAWHDEGIGRQIDRASVQVRIAARRPQVGCVEVVGVAPRVEAARAQIDGIGACRHRRLEGRASTRRRQKLRFSRLVFTHVALLVRIVRIVRLVCVVWPPRLPASGRATV